MCKSVIVYGVAGSAVQDRHQTAPLDVSSIERRSVMSRELCVTFCVGEGLFVG